jgi:hypothetical protein
MRLSWSVLVVASSMPCLPPLPDDVPGRAGLKRAGRSHLAHLERDRRRARPAGHPTAWPALGSGPLPAPGRSRAGLHDAAAARVLRAARDQPNCWSAWPERCCRGAITCAAARSRAARALPYLRDPRGASGRWPLAQKIGVGSWPGGRGDHPPGRRRLSSVRAMTVWSGVRVSSARPPASVAIRAACGVPAEENAMIAGEGASTVASPGPPFMARRTSGRR